jgi:hypothetical protein
MRRTRLAGETALPFLLLGVLVPLGAHAQAVPTDAQVAEAERLFDAGVAAVEAGDFQTGLRDFHASFDANPVPDALYNIGMCLKALGDFPAAANAFRDYVTLVGDRMTPEERAEFDALLGELVPRIGRLVIETDEPGVGLVIDGAPAGTSPLPSWVAVSPGQHNIEGSKEGFVTTLMQVGVGEGDTVTARLELTPVGLPTGAPPLPGVPVEVSAEPSGPGPGFWMMAGVAGAAALSMAITGGLTLKYNDDFKAGGATDLHLRDTALSLRTATDVLLGVALATGVAAVVLLLLPGREQATSDEAPRAAVALAPSGLVVWW